MSLKPLDQWNPSDVSSDISSIGLGQYSRLFAENSIRGEHLSLITESHLRELGISSIGHRILLLVHFRKLLMSPKGQMASDMSSDIVHQTPTNASASRFTRKPEIQNEISSESPRQVPTRQSDMKSGQKSSQPKFALQASDLDSDQSSSHEKQKDSYLAIHSDDSVKRTQKPTPKRTEEEERNDDYFEVPPPSKMRFGESQQQPAQPVDAKVECIYCKRKFSPDIIQSHQNACAKISAKKARPSDSVKPAQNEAEEPPKRAAPTLTPKRRGEDSKLGATMAASRNTTEYEKEAEKTVNLPKQSPAANSSSEFVVCPYCGIKKPAGGIQLHLKACANLNSRRVQDAKAMCSANKRTMN